MKKIIAVALALLMSFSCFSLISFAEESEGTEHLSEVPEGYVGIYTKEDLDNVKLNMSGKYILMNDIVFEDSDYKKGGDFYNSGKGWEPIGNTSLSFQGIFDGNGYSIINLKIKSPDANIVGLFGSVSNALIKNTNLINTDIKGNNYVGGIAGRVYYSNIENCVFAGYVEGNQHVGGICGYFLNSGGVSKQINNSVSRGSVIGSENVGGIVGAFFTYANTDVTISACGNVAVIKAMSQNAGGICGRAEIFSATDLSRDMYISTSYNSGNVESQYNAGGIVGYCTGVGSSANSNVFIRNCMNTGNINATDATGGIVGYIFYFSVLQNSYSVGKVSAKTNFGALIGTKGSPFSANANYYLDESTSNPTLILGDSKSADQLKKQTTFTNWDFNSIWTMTGRADYLYPELRNAPLLLPEDFVHKHDYTSRVTKEPTHLVEGEITYTCACGDSYTEAIAKLEGHTYTSEVTKEATHLEEGETTYTCACGDTYTEVIAKLEGHTYTSEVTKEATHLEEGETTYTCACGDSYTEAIAKLEGHTYTSELTKEATHLEEGETTYTCECGDSYTEVIAKLTGHTYEKAVTAPTCTAQGYTTYTCECGDSYVADYTDKLDHEYTSEITTPATHLTEGIETFTCECGDSYRKPVAKLKGHTYTSEVTKEPTHLEEGEMTFTCECGDSYTEVIEKIAKHNYKEDVTEPTCTAKGYTTYTCECGDIYVADYTEAKGHIYSVTTTQPTCTQNGLVTTFCTSCGDTHTETLEPTGHSFAEGSSKCENCDFDKADDCSCNCHKGGISGLIFKIILFFQRIFKTNKTCACGIAHY